MRRIAKARVSTRKISSAVRRSRCKMFTCGCLAYVLDYFYKWAVLLFAPNGVIVSFRFGQTSPASVKPHHTLVHWSRISRWSRISQWSSISQWSRISSERSFASVFLLVGHSNGVNFSCIRVAQRPSASPLTNQCGCTTVDWCTNSNPPSD